MSHNELDDLNPLTLGSKKEGCTFYDQNGDKCGTWDSSSPSDNLNAGQVYDTNGNPVIGVTVYNTDNRQIMTRLQNLNAGHDVPPSCKLSHPFQFRDKDDDNNGLGGCALISPSIKQQQPIMSY